MLDLHTQISLSSEQNHSHVTNVAIDIEACPDSGQVGEACVAGFNENNPAQTPEVLYLSQFRVELDRRFFRPSLPQNFLSICPDWLADGAPVIEQLVNNKHVVFYNSANDLPFFPNGLKGAASISCAMKRVAHHGGRWSKSHQNYSYINLEEARLLAGLPKPSGLRHRAGYDAICTAQIWQWCCRKDTLARGFDTGARQPALI